LGDKLSTDSTERVRILNIEIDRIGVNQTVEKIDKFIRNNRPKFVCTANVDHVIQCLQDQEFRQIYREADLAVPDGVPLLWAARILGKSLIERVNGTNLFFKLCERASKKGYRIFFLGAPPGVAARAASNLKHKFKGLKIVGTYAPPLDFFNDRKENTRIIRMIHQARPHILFVGLGAPKQEKWIYRHLPELKVPVSIGIGASFEYAAGVTKRAPRWMQNIGLEWLYRISENPKRYWKRYFLQDFKFFPLIFKQAFAEAFISNGWWN
jgi:N-acetylglucosaminyldiphosphoundecaprenol N-acetyl-beta-D-mannosaminyltransferase